METALVHSSLVLLDVAINIDFLKVVSKKLENLSRMNKWYNLYLPRERSSTKQLKTPYPDSFFLKILYCQDILFMLFIYSIVEIEMRLSLKNAKRDSI